MFVCMVLKRDKSQKEIKVRLDYYYDRRTGITATAAANRHFDNNTFTTSNLWVNYHYLKMVFKY